MHPEIERCRLAEGLTITRVLTGLWQIADMERDGNATDPAAAASAMQAYVDAGLTTFDMADHYGSSELLAGHFKAHSVNGDATQMFTKWVPQPGTITRDDVRAAVERALNRMQTDRLDLLQFHTWSYADPRWFDCLFWLQELKDDPPALAKAVTDNITDEVAALRGKLVEFDVINEPYSNHDLQDILGDEAMVAWFKAARAADADLKLYINDYSIVSGGGMDRAHQDHYERTISYLLDKGAPLDGIGIQSHFGNALTPPVRVLKILDRYAAFKLPIQITELDVDIPDERLQADYLRDFMIAAFSHPAVEGIFMWGFWEGRHWRPTAALYRRDWSIKPNGQAWLDLVQRQWTTDARGRTDSAGQFAARGFLGRYTITVEQGGKTSTRSVELARPGSAVTITLGGE